MESLQFVFVRKENSNELLASHERNRFESDECTTEQSRQTEFGVGKRGSSKKSAPFSELI